MKTAISVMVVFLVLVFGVVGIGVISYISAHNSGNEQEEQIDALYKDNQNILGQYSLKIKEAAKVSDKYTAALKDVVTAAIEGRYGDQGSQAVMQWITEQNPTVDPSIYLKLQQLIESGRNEFKVAQTRLLDQCRVYKTDLGYLWGGFWLKLAGYPREGLEKKCTPVQSEYSRDSFNTGIEKGLDF